MPAKYPPSHGRSHPLAGTARILVADPDRGRWDSHLIEARSISQVVTQVESHEDAIAAVQANAGLQAVVLVGQMRERPGDTTGSVNWTKSLMQLLASRSFPGLVLVLNDGLGEADQSEMEEILPGQVLLVRYSFLYGRARWIFDPLREFPHPDPDRLRQIAAGIIAQAPHIESWR